MGRGLKVDVCGMINFIRYETERIPKYEQKIVYWANSYGTYSS
jgi:hypothetical protein